MGFYRNLSIKIYERTIVFVQRMMPQGVEGFFKYANVEFLLKSKLFDFSDFENADFGDDPIPIQKSISFPNKNIKIIGQPDKLIISLLDTDATDKYFYEISKKFSDLFIKENISAIGINFNGVIETKKAEEIIKNKIISKMPNNLNDADGASFKLVYKDSQGKALSIIGIDAGEIQLANTTKEGILISYNYHRDIKTQQLMKDSMDKFQDSLEEIKEKFDVYKSKLESLLNG